MTIRIYTIFIKLFGLYHICYYIGVMNGEYIELGTDTLSNYLTNGEVIVVFGTKWCTHCVELKPVLKNLSDVMTIIFVDVEKCPRSKRLYPRPMEGYPTIAVFNNGYFIEEIEGNIVDWFNEKLLNNN